MRIQCISLHQPWASLVACEEKRIETRSWRCPLPPGTLLAIHAAKKWSGELASLCLSEPFLSALDPERRLIWNGRVCPLPTGAVVAVVRLGECLPIVAKPHQGEKGVAFDEDGILRVWTPFDFGGQHGHSGDGYQHVAEHEASFGDYSPGRSAWLLDAVVRLSEPVPERGRQSLWAWSVPDEMIDVVRSLEEQDQEED